jgi:hypothetical protein
MHACGQPGSCEADHVAPATLVADLAWCGREALRDPPRLDRRRAPRWAVEGTATLLGLGTELGMLAELVRLEGSPWWLSGLANAAVPAGTRVSVGFSAPDGRPATGTVERCEERGTGRFHLAVRFDGAPG